MSEFQDKDKEKSSSKHIPYARQCIDNSDIEAVVAALKSDFLTQGPRVQYFENAITEVTGAKYAVALSSGTAALHLVMLGLGVGKADYGVVPAITFAATANCLRYVGANVSFSDVDALTGISCIQDFKDAIARSDELGKLRILLPVSFTGSVPGLDRISEYASKNGAFVVEDAAHSIGARYRLRDDSIARSGSCQHSDAAILSFHPVKHICAGEGGAVVTNDKLLADRVRRLRSHGIEKLEDWRYNQRELGYNYRMTDLQAALGKSQLKKLDTFIEKRSAIVHRYISAFSEKPFSGAITIPTQNNLSSWHLFVIQFQDSEKRKGAYDFFRQKGIFSQVHYMPVYQHEYYRSSVGVPLAGAESFSSRCLSLPLYPSLSDEDQNFVIASLREFIEG